MKIVKTPPYLCSNQNKQNKNLKQIGLAIDLAVLYLKENDIINLINNNKTSTMKELLAIADAKFGVYKKKAFSEILGITNDRFLKICSGDEQPSTNELAKISECLGVAFYLKGGEIRVVIDNN